MKNQNDIEYKITRSTTKYDLLVQSDGTRGILCKRCGIISWNPLDHKYRYCNNCRLFICLITEAFEGWKEDEDTV